MKYGRQLEKKAFSLQNGGGTDKIRESHDVPCLESYDIQGVRVALAKSGITQKKKGGKGG